MSTTPNFRRRPTRSGSGTRKPRVAGSRNRYERPGEDAHTPDVTPESELDHSSAEETATSHPDESESCEPNTETIEPAGDVEHSPSSDSDDLPETTRRVGVSGGDLTAADDDTTTTTGSGTDATDPGEYEAGATATDEKEARTVGTREGDAAARAESADSGDVGEAETDSDDADTRDAATASGTAGSGDSGRLAVMALGVVLTLVFGGLAYWFHSEAYSLRHEGPASNRALVNQAATSEVKGQMTTAVEKLFSYDYNNTKKTEQAADKYLAGNANKQYDTMFKPVKNQAPKQKMVLTSTVPQIGVTMLQGDRAELFAFVNQNATRADNGSGATYAAHLTITAEKRDGSWKITSMKQY